MKEKAIKYCETQKAGNQIGQKYVELDLCDQIKNIIMSFQRTLHDIAHKLEISPETVRALVKKNKIKKCCRNLKPLLTQSHKTIWVGCIWGFIFKDEMYCNMMQYVHINEKLFTLVHNKDGYYLPDNKELYYSAVKYKSHIAKAMFLSTIACPCLLSTGKLFNGMLGVWAFAQQMLAKQNSKNRPKGMLVWEQLSVNKDKVRQMVLEKLLPFINQNWPAGSWRKPVFVQQDKALPCLRANNKAFENSRLGKRLDICLVRQPAQLPDLNVNSWLVLRDQLSPLSHFCNRHRQTY